MLFAEYAFASETAAEHGGEGLASTLGSVYPNLAAIWPTWVAFIVLFVLLYKFAFPSIISMLDKRSEAIKESLTKAEETKVEAERLLEEYKVQMAEARAEAGKVIAQSRKVSETMQAEMKVKAEEQAAAIIAKAKQALESEKKAAMVELQGAIAEIAVGAAGKVIGEKLTVEDHAKLIDSYITEMGSLND